MFGQRNNTYQPQFRDQHIYQDPYSWNGSYQGLDRQQQLPNPYMDPYWHTNQGNWQNPYSTQAYAGNPSLQGNPYLNQPYMMAGPKSKISKKLFQNPLQPQNDPIYGYYSNQDFQNYNPYPQNAFMPKQSSGIQSIMNSFKSQDGNLDFNKMVDTAGQMVNAVSQVSSLVKGIGGIFKV